MIPSPPPTKDSMNKDQYILWDSDTSDKELTIEGPNDILIRVDYDDVDHEKILQQTKKMVEILNRSMHAAC